MSDHKEIKILEGGEEVILEIENDESEQGLDSDQPPDSKKMKIMEEEEEEEDMSLEIEEVEPEDDEPEDSLDSDLLQKKSLFLQNGVNKAAFRTGNLFGPYDIRGSPVLINGKPIEFEEGLKLDRNGRRGSFVYQTNDPNTVETSDKIYIVFTTDQTNIRVETDSYYVCNVHSNYVHLNTDGNVVIRARNDTNDAFVRIRQCDLVADQQIIAKGITLNPSGSVAVINSDNNWLRLHNNQSGNYIEVGATQNTMVGNLVCGNGGIGSQTNHIVRFPTGPKGDVDDVLAIDSVDGDIVRTKWTSPGEYDNLQILGFGTFASGLDGGHQNAVLFCRKSRVDKSKNIYHLVLYGSYSSAQVNFDNVVIEFPNIPPEEHPLMVYRSCDVSDRDFIQGTPLEGHSYNDALSLFPFHIEGIDIRAPSSIFTIRISGRAGESYPADGDLYSIITF